MRERGWGNTLTWRDELARLEDSDHWDPTKSAEGVAEELRRVILQRIEEGAVRMGLLEKLIRKLWGSELRLERFVSDVVDELLQEGLIRWHEAHNEERFLVRNG